MSTNKKQQQLVCAVLKKTMIRIRRLFFKWFFFQTAVFDAEKLISHNENEQLQKKLKDAEDDIKTSVKLKVQLYFFNFVKTNVCYI